MICDNSYVIRYLALQEDNFTAACEKAADSYMSVVQLAWLWFHSCTCTTTGYYGKSYKDLMEPTPKHIIEKLATDRKKVIPVDYTGDSSDVLTLFYLLELE